MKEYLGSGERIRRGDPKVAILGDDPRGLYALVLYCRDR